MIQMISGVFGLPVEGIVKAMDKNSGPFKASAEQEARLVRLGLARYVDEPMEANRDKIEDEVDELVEDIGPIGFDETPPDDSEMDEAEVEEIDLAELSAKELREVGREYGLAFKATTSKASMIQAIEAAQAELVDNSADDDDDPAPTFDASEAVL